jgi:hypothetical protein
VKYRSVCFAAPSLQSSDCERARPAVGRHGRAWWSGVTLPRGATTTLAVSSSMAGGRRLFSLPVLASPARLGARGRPSSSCCASWRGWSRGQACCRLQVAPAVLSASEWRQPSQKGQHTARTTEDTRTPLAKPPRSAESSHGRTVRSCPAAAAAASATTGDTNTEGALCETMYTVHSLPHHVRST